MNDHKTSLLHCQVMVRICLFEEKRHLSRLQEFLGNGGYPFVTRNDILELAAFDDIGDGYGAIELFVLPINLGALMNQLLLPAVDAVLETSMNLMDLPLLAVRRRRQPADPDSPFLEFKLLLNLLPSYSFDRHELCAADTPTLIRPVFG